MGVSKTPTDKKRPSSVRRSLVALLLMCCVPVAQAATADALKTIAIFGSLLSYGHGYTLRDELVCTQSFRAGVNWMTDAELRALSFSMGLKDCEAPGLPTTEQVGLRFRLSPAIALSSWQADASATYKGTSEITFTPKVYYIWPAFGQRFDLGFGIGLSYLMDPSVGNRVKSTNFQFSDEFSLGLSDASDRFRIAYQYRHISNLDIQTPNNGVDFNGIVVTVRMQ